MSRGIWTCVNKKLYFFVFISYSILNINSNVFLKEKKYLRLREKQGKTITPITPKIFFAKFCLVLKNFLVKILRRVVTKRPFLVTLMFVRMQKPN